ncbi:hypothetical protein [Haloarcula litorea]|uniref:hypothetical protein n=1 Tax=Haloarcula litorea TaxID=3032579 RepID=UPI0023E8ACB1|nr:hypothetical protein [Halomicroarcula sp. GDY20]
MSVDTRRKSLDSYIIDAKDGTDVELELVDPTTGETYPVVGYADRLLAEKLDVYDVGCSVRVDIAPVDEARERWEVTRMVPGSPPRSGIGR